MMACCIRELRRRTCGGIILSAAMLGTTIAAPAHAFAIVTEGALARNTVMLAGDGPRFPMAPSTGDIDIATALTQRLRTKFDAATARSNHLLTPEVAREANWGFAVSHFAEIDRDSDGLVTFAEMSDFMDERSPVKKPSEKPIQIIE